MKVLFTLSLLIIFQNSFASIMCHTPKMDKYFVIDQDNVAFTNHPNEIKKREVASLTSRNKITSSGMTKIVDYSNNKVIIHIEDTHHFSELNDYMSIRNNLGHEITYSIICENK
jgi:hypothetical protein